MVTTLVIVSIDEKDATSRTTSAALTIAQSLKEVNSKIDQAEREQSMSISCCTA